MNSNQRKNKILDPVNPLCRDDVIWMLEYIKKKVADKDPLITDLSQPHLLQGFQLYAEAAISLISPMHYSDYEAQRLRKWLRWCLYDRNGTSTLLSP